MLSCLWDGAYKRTLAVHRKKVAHMAAAGFLSRYLNGPLPYVLLHITVNKNVLSALLNKTFPSFTLQNVLEDNGMHTSQIVQEQHFTDIVA